MSGANCDSGCTDCPTCRGEVRPDAPVMKDMAFAMSMGEHGMAESGAWGALGVLGMVRKGIQARGGSSSDDVRMSRWIDQNTFQLSAGADGRVPNSLAAFVERGTSIALDGGDISLHTIGASAPGIVIGVEVLGSAHTPGRQEVPPRRKKGGGGGGPAKPTDTENVKCCISKFCYPKRFNMYFDVEHKSLNMTFVVEAEYLQDGSISAESKTLLDNFINLQDPDGDGGPGPQLDPLTGRMKNPPDTDPGLPYETDPVNCYCPCCRFEQLKKLDVVKGAKHEDAKPFDWTKDCFWFLEGQPGKPLGFYPKDPSDPKKPQEKWVLVCAGVRAKSDDPGFKELTQWWSEDGCKYRFVDNPTFTLVDGPFHIKISWEGRIWDTCKKTLKKVKYFTVEVEGTTTNGAPDPATFKGSVTSAGKKTDMGKLEKNGDVWEPPSLKPDEDAKCR